MHPSWLPDEPDGEASFPVYKTNNPTEIDQSFLLIVCTGRIVTHGVSRRGYRQILRVSSIWPDAHRTVTGAGGSEFTLGPFILLRPITGRRDCLPALRVATQIGLYHPRSVRGPAYSL